MEIAFVSANKLRFELDKKQKNLSASILGIFFHHPQQFISTMLVGNNVALVVYGLLMAKLLTPIFQVIDNQFVVTTLQTIVATIIVLFTGEFLPKTIFRINPNFWLKIFSWVLLFFYIVLYPISKFSAWMSYFFMRIFGIKIEKNKSENVFSRIDLNYLVQESIDSPNKEIDIQNEVKIFQNALDFSKVRLRDCSVPRTEIIALDYEVSVEVLKATFIETGFSKIPIYKHDIDNIIGYIHSSEMFEHKTDWKKQINQIPIVPESMAAQKLMKVFMQQKKSIAVVVDEFGGTAGIITLEDIIEEIFGEIEDEHDNKDYQADKISDNEYILSGRLEVETANTKFGLNIPESDEYETIAGLILYYHQNFPKLNEQINIEDFNFKCIKVNNNRVETVKLSV
ncbi:MAG: hemolysin [Porphyromonadaceae bacterium CG2_30_38_12]|nr:MAG: hemolysin [Porphyromonadaceae bacterium CG2_30_38_12]